MMHREAANLYFIGFFQPLGCIWRLANHQARIAALQIAGYLNRPADIVARIAREMGTRHRRFDQSTRHAIEVDSHEFRRELLAYIKTARIAPRDLHGSIWDQRGAPHQGSDIGKIVVRRSESSNATECNAESV